MRAHAGRLVEDQNHIDRSIVANGSLSRDIRSLHQGDAASFGVVTSSDDSRSGVGVNVPSMPERTWLKPAGAVREMSQSRL